MSRLFAVADERRSAATGLSPQGVGGHGLAERMCQISLEVPSVLALPNEVVLQLAMTLGVDAIALGSCCHSLCPILCDESLWRFLLQRDCGFTERGLSLWLGGGHTLIKAYDYWRNMHRPLEAVLLRESLEVNAEGWKGCRDLKLTVELANPWPVPVWTFFRICSPGATPWAAAVQDGSLQLWRKSVQRIVCTGFAAPGDRDAIVVSLATSPECEPAACERVRRLRSPQLAEAWQRATAVGYMLGDGELEADVLAAPTTQAMLVPAHASDGGLVVLAEHTLRLDEAAWSEAVSARELGLEIMSCIDVRAHGLVGCDGVPLTLEQASPVELCCDRGVQVPTTADGSHRRRARANRAICGRAFEWRHSERYKAISAEHRHDSKRHHILQEQSWESGATVEFRGDTSVIQGGWELAGQAASVPRGDELAPLNFTVLCHGRASVPLRPADLA